MAKFNGPEDVYAELVDKQPENEDWLLGLVAFAGVIYGYLQDIYRTSTTQLFTGHPPLINPTHRHQHAII